MKRSCVTVSSPLAVVVALLGAAQAQAQCLDHMDILIGRSAGGQLKLVNVPGDIVVCPVDGLLKGYASGQPGFGAVAVDDPPNDLFTLASGASVRLEAVGLESALKVWGPSLGTLMDAPGERILLGGPGLHTHVTWHVDSQDANYDVQDMPWTGTFRLVDTGSTGYTASANFSFSFAPEPEVVVPAASQWGLVALALSVLIAGTLLCSAAKPS